jgi:hypothetical protein
VLQLHHLGLERTDAGGGAEEIWLLPAGEDIIACENR